jgi:FtsP/CotA-like multicopper oxidase with cupredoxin domain
MTPPNLSRRLTPSRITRTGETVDIFLDVANPGIWMAHCHIAEQAVRELSGLM